MHKIGLILDIQTDKPASFYQQIIQTLDQRVSLFDLDKELIVLNSTGDSKAALELLEDVYISAEEITLLLLPPDSDLYLPFTDYGFTSKANQHYVYEHLVREFRFKDYLIPTDEASNALLQIQEHLIAQYTINSISYYIVDQQFKELIERIAIAYKCAVFFTKP